MTPQRIGSSRPHAARSVSARRWRRIVAAGLSTALAGTLATVSLAPAQAMQSDTLTMTTTMLAPSTYEERVQRQVNRRRANHGLRRLRLVSCADVTAETWSRYLATTDQFFHQSMGTVLDRCDAQYAGETLGRGTMTPRRLVRLWMQSPGHRAILLSGKPRRIGIGATYDADGRVVVAANFVRL